MKKIRMGMVGGGEGAFIGGVHRMAAAIDGEVELVCGAFSADTQRSARSGAALGLAEQRVYSDYQQMMIAEAALPEAQRMQFVAIVTPNHLHYAVAVAALEAGFHVLSDKPATLDLQQALRLRTMVRDTGLHYGLTHTYTGYPMVREARQRIADGALGTLRRIVVEYPQGWLASTEDAHGNKQAAWRLDPEQAGVSACMADIGVHAANLAEYVSGQAITEVCADLAAVVAGRTLDDDGAMLLRFTEGIRGMLFASQVCAGEENALRLCVYGEKGSLEWQHREPNSLMLKWPERPMEILRTGGTYLSAASLTATRLPIGHPEGYLEAFANIYCGFARRIRAAEHPGLTQDGAYECPGIEEAVRGMAFIELAVAASASDIKWHHFVVS